MKRYVKKIVMMTFMLLSAVTTYADVVKPPDLGSIEAMVANHKSYGIFLGSRNVLEAGLDSVHGNTQKQIDNYKDTSEKLDKYKRGLPSTSILAVPAIMNRKIMRLNIRFIPTRSSFITKP